jgi:hypothetical protein
MKCQAGVVGAQIRGAFFKVKVGNRVHRTDRRDAADRRQVEGAASSNYNRRMHLFTRSSGDMISAQNRCVNVLTTGVSAK